MTDKELDKYINQIAFSGAEEFVTNTKILTQNLLLDIWSWFLFCIYGC